MKQKTSIVFILIVDYKPLFCKEYNRTFNKKPQVSDTCGKCYNVQPRTTSTS